MPPGIRANRNDFRTHVDDELVSMQAEDLAVRESERKAEIRELNAIAALKDHPGWHELMKVWEPKIHNYRSGAFLAELLKTDTPNERIGELTRVGNLVADEMEALKNAVDVADEQIEEERASARRNRPERGL